MDSGCGERPHTGEHSETRSKGQWHSGPWALQALLLFPALPFSLLSSFLLTFSSQPLFNDPFFFLSEGTCCSKRAGGLPQVWAAGSRGPAVRESARKQHRLPRAPPSVRARARTHTHDYLGASQVSGAQATDTGTQAHSEDTALSP